MEHAEDSTQVKHYIFNPSQPIGKGTFSEVFEAFDTNNLTGPRLVVKVIPKNLLSSDSNKNQRIAQELDVLKKIRSPHIVHIIDSYDGDDENLYLFTRYCDEGSLEERIQNEGPIPENEALKIVKQIAETFLNIDSNDVRDAYGHDRAVMHRDINPKNILFDQGKVMLSNFGFAKVIDDIDENISQGHTSVQNGLYTSPQIIDFGEYSAKCDVWSTGIVLYEAIFGEIPGKRTKPTAICEDIKAGRLDFPTEIDSNTKDLIKNMLQHDEEKRFSWSQVNEHAALKNKFS